MSALAVPVGRALLCSRLWPPVGTLPGRDCALFGRRLSSRGCLSLRAARCLESAHPIADHRSAPLSSPWFPSRVLGSAGRSLEDDRAIPPPAHWACCRRALISSRRRCLPWVRAWVYSRVCKPSGACSRSSTRALWRSPRGSARRALRVGDRRAQSGAVVSIVRSRQASVGAEHGGISSCAGPLGRPARAAHPPRDEPRRGAPRGARVLGNACRGMNNARTPRSCVADTDNTTEHILRNLGVTIALRPFPATAWQGDLKLPLQGRNITNRSCWCRGAQSSLGG